MDPDPPPPDITKPIGRETAGGLFGIAGGVSAPSLPEQAGEQIGPYKLREQIGEGGFGSVWVADQEAPIQRRVALKIIKLGMDTRDVVARFEQERQALALMDHPNIAKVLDAGATQWGRPFFVMELVRGIRITDYCDQANLPTVERLKLFAQVCHAVQHAHQKGIIHRDLKPSNILVTLHDGVPVPKVIDFGIAKATQGRLTDKTIYTQLMQMIGTPLYMSPEQTELSGLDVDTRSDIYSLGVLLYELLVGRTPFDSETLMKAGLDEMRRMIREQEPPKPSTAMQTMPAEVRATVAARRQADAVKMTRLLRGDLDWIVMKALEKDRTRRYETASGFAEDIRRYLANEPVTAAAPSVAYRFGKFARRNRLALAAGGAVLLALIAGIAISTWQAIRATRAEALAETRLAEAKRLTRRATDAEALAVERLEQVTVEKERADDEAATAKAVQAFLQDDLLKQAGSHAQSDRQEKPNPNLTVREALDRASKSIASQFHDRPLVEAAIRETMGMTYLELGDAESAMPHFRRGIEIANKHFGPESPRTLASREQLAGALDEQGMYSEAEQEHRAVLAIRERLSGAEHEDTLLSRHNLSIALARQGRDAEAEKELRAVLAVRDRVIGAEHPLTLGSRNELAMALHAQNRYTEAEAEFRKVIAIRERIHGVEHPDFLGVRIGLANTLKRQGKFNEAVSEHRAVLAISERVLGADHPDTLRARGGLANALSAQGKEAEAEIEYRATIAARERVIGKEHPDTLSNRMNLANTLAALGRLAEAEQENRTVLEVRERALGPEHAETLMSRVSIAHILGERGMRAEAEEEFRAVLAIQERVLGQEHPNTLDTRNLLAATLFFQKKFTDAEREHRATLAIRERMLGGEHPNTLMSCANIAMCLEAQGKLADALELIQRANRGWTKAFGPEHPFSKRSKEQLERIKAKLEAK